MGMAYPRTETPETPRSTADQSLEDFSTNVRIVGVHEFDEVSFDKMAPLVVKGAVARASEKWTDEWLLQRFGDDYLQASLDSRPAMTSFKKQMALGEYLDILKQSKGSEQPLEYLFHSQRNLQGIAGLLRMSMSRPPSRVLETLLHDASSWGRFCRRSSSPSSHLRDQLPGSWAKALGHIRRR